jgi:23S rRNA (cytidine1920-2'-O)/16S rRNA (cytidine1409-2'-O)-methyltransferase
MPHRAKRKSPPHGRETPAPASRKPPKQRLDILLVARGLAPTRQRAQALILAGQVRVNSQRSDKAGAAIPSDAVIEIVGEGLRYASRAGLKLEGALEDLGISVEGLVCLDVGSSTGGFTDCLLQHGARRVYAVDVTTDQLAWKLQHDARIVRVKRNARYLKPADIGEAVDLVTIDVSFISVSKMLPAIVAAARPAADFLVLIKPQFELDRRDIGKGGIVRDPALHARAIERVVSEAAQSGLKHRAVVPSRLTGAEGNAEFFLHARRIE